jgi:asparagine synthase (glutamine-hydrolysing)
MCGILGVATSGPERMDVALLKQQLDTLQHRGPDGHGVWVSPDWNVALAHRRLAIIDLSPSGRQPMEDASGSLVVVFNGEIYNYRSLRDELIALGSSFHTASDTEVLLEAYRVWGVDCLARLDGMFAFALLDRRANRLFAARDRAGEKPFFYRASSGRLEFASELKALLKHPNFPRKLDTDSLSFYLAYGYVPGDRCIVQGVRKLPPAHALTYDVGAGELRVWRYWSLPHALVAPIRDPVEALDECTRLLEASVRLRLVADVPVGILLSGGVDSSLITAMAARGSTAAVSTFTVSFPGFAAFDEAPYARAVARHFGTRHTELRADEDSADLLPALARQFDEPLGDHSVIPTYLVCRLVRQHATVALGGDGGDELFGGYPHYNMLMQMEQLRKWAPSGIRRAVARASALLPVGTRGRNHLVGFGEDVPNSLAHINMFFDERSRRALVGQGAVPVAFRDCPERYKAGLCRSDLSVLQQATRLDFETTLAEDYLVKTDRASMLASLELRAPFLDPRLIEFAFSRLPDQMRSTGTERKVLLRGMANRLLPKDVDWRRKQGFSLPLASWLKGSLGRFVSSVLREADPDLFSPSAIEQLLQGQQRGLNNANRIFTLTMFELWRREYGISLPVRTAPSLQMMV